MTMLDRLDADAQRCFECAHHEARRLGHRYIGTEHLLLALAADPSAGDVLAAYDCGPDRVRGDIVALIGRGQRDERTPDALLATLGIDLAAIRQRVESTFGPDAMSRAALATLPRRRRRWPGRRWWPGCDLGRPAHSALVGGDWFGLAPRLKQVIEIAVRRAAPQPASPLHLLDAILHEGRGVACQILDRHHVDFTALRASVRTRLG